MDLDIIVTGTGRSATSFTSMMLSEHFNICMGKDLRKKVRPTHRWGVWEYEPKNSWSPKNTHMIPTEKILDTIETSHDHQCEGILKGLKAPFFSQLTKNQWGLFHERHNIKLVIWCWRPTKMVLYSLLNKYTKAGAKARAEAEEWVNRGLDYMEKSFTPDAPFKSVKLDFTEEVSKEELIALLSSHLEKLQCLKTK